MIASTNAARLNTTTLIAEGLGVVYRVISSKALIAIQTSAGTYVYTKQGELVIVGQRQAIVISCMVIIICK